MEVAENKFSFIIKDGNWLGVDILKKIKLNFLFLIFYTPYRMKSSSTMKNFIVVCV